MAVALCWFAFASLGFMLARPWDHQWWLAHAIFATGFSLLGYGVLRAYLTTGSFERVFSSQELSEDLAQTNARLQATLEQLERANHRMTEQMRDSDIARAQFEALFTISPDGIKFGAHPMKTFIIEQTRPVAGLEVVHFSAAQWRPNERELDRLAGPELKAAYEAVLNRLFLCFIRYPQLDVHARRDESNRRARSSRQWRCARAGIRTARGGTWPTRPRKDGPGAL